VRPSRVSEALDPLGLGPVDVLENLAFDASHERPYLTGSLADGFGNARSDVDLIILSERASEPSDRRAYALGRWIDCRVAPVDGLRHLVERCAAAAAFPERWGRSLLRYGEADALHRCRVALPFDATATDPLVDDGAVRRALALMHLFSARNMWFDVIGARESGQSEQCAVFLELIRGLLFDAAAALAGETNPNRKWSRAKARRLAGSSHPALAALPEPDCERDVDEAVMAIGDGMFALMCLLHSGREPPELLHPGFGAYYEIEGDTVFHVAASSERRRITMLAPENDRIDARETR